MGILIFASECRLSAYTDSQIPACPTISTSDCPKVASWSKFLSFPAGKGNQPELEWPQIMAYSRGPSPREDISRGKLATNQQ